MTGSIEVNRDGEWQALEFANETPAYPCRIAGEDGLFASAWLSLHTDDGVYGEADRLQTIVPHFIAGEPVLLAMRDGVLVDLPLVLGEPVVIDLLLPHALLPRQWADAVLEHGHDRFDAFDAWWSTLYDDEDVAPVLAWSSRPCEHG